MKLPSLSQQEFGRRWRAAQQSMKSAGLDVLLAYGDDHAVFGPANVRYLANFPVHFEPACVVIPSNGKPALITGPETAAYAEIVATTPRIAAIEEFGVPGEEYPYLKMSTLGSILAEVSDSKPGRVGVAGLDQMAVDTWDRIRPALNGQRLFALTAS